MTSGPVDRRQLLVDACDRLVNPLTGLRLRLEELQTGHGLDPDVALGLGDALRTLDRLDGELRTVLDELLDRLPQASSTAG